MSPIRYGLLAILLGGMAAGAVWAQGGAPQLDLPPLPPLPGTEEAAQVQPDPNALPPLPVPPAKQPLAIPGAEVVQSFEAPPLQKLPEPAKLAEPVLPPLPAPEPVEAETATEALPPIPPLAAAEEKPSEKTVPLAAVGAPPLPVPVPTPQQSVQPMPMPVLPSLPKTEIAEPKAETSAALPPLPQITEGNPLQPKTGGTANLAPPSAPVPPQVAPLPQKAEEPSIPALPSQVPAGKIVTSIVPEEKKTPEDPKVFGALTGKEREAEMNRMMERLDSGMPQKEFKEMTSEEQQQELDKLLKSFESGSAKEEGEAKEEETAIGTGGQEAPSSISAEAKKEADPLWKKRDTVMAPPREKLYGKNFRTQRTPAIIDKKYYNRQNAHLPASVHEEDLYAQFFHAAHNGNLQGLRALLEDYGLYFNRQNREGNTALITAALAGQAEAAAILLARGADPNIQNDMGMTALHVASSKGHYDIVSALLQAGANPNIEAKKGVTPLRMALAANHIDIAELLLVNKARRESRFISDMRPGAPSPVGAFAKQLQPFEDASMQKRQAAQEILMQATPAEKPVSASSPMEDVPAQISGRSLPRIRKAQAVFAELKEINRYFPDLTFDERMQVNAKRKAYEEEYADVIATMMPEERKEIDSIRFIWDGWERANAAEISAYKRGSSRSIAN